mmetsp:Transcript_20389/g.33753  ORF Transcript_20389/g.33753 Transcript_20389/m.33753 type:complete len:200 (-) Transcript_20389:300-899(-)
MGPWVINSVVIIDAIQNIEEPQKRQDLPKKAYGFLRSRSQAEDRRLSPVKSRRYSALDRYRSCSQEPNSSYTPPVRESSVSVRRRSSNIEIAPPVPKPRRARSFSLRQLSREAPTGPPARASSIRRRQPGNGTNTLPTQLETRRARSFSIRSLSKEQRTLTPVRESSVHDGQTNTRPPLPLTKGSRRSFRILPLAAKHR